MSNKMPPNYYLNQKSEDRIPLAPDQLAAADAAIKKLLDAHRVVGASRMIKTDANPHLVTDQEKQAVIDAVKAYMKERGIKQSQLAQGLCIGSSSVSQILSGTYNADSANIVIAMDRWLERRKKSDESPQVNKFVLTDVARQIRVAAQRAMATADAGLDSRISLVWGDPGCGKTIALKAVQESEDAIFITCGADVCSTSHIINEIAEQIRVPVQWSAQKTFKEVVNKLRGSGKLIIVDEIHALLDAKNDTPFHTLRRLSDQTGCPQLWAATCDLIKELEVRERKREPLGQIISRIGSQFHLTAKLHASNPRGRSEPLYTVEQVLQAYGSNEMKLTRDAAKFLARLCTSPRHGLLRTCTNLVLTATAMNRMKSRELTVEMLWEAVSLLFQDSIIKSIYSTAREELSETKYKLAIA